MALSIRSREILVAPEDAYNQGTDVGNLVALLAIEAALPSMQAQTAERKTIQPHLGSRAKQTWQKRMPLQWSHEAVGSGDVAVPPHFDAMLLAAGWSRVTLTGTATVAAAPVAVGTPTGGWSYAVTTGFTGANRRRVTVTCTTAGGSGVAQATVAAPATGLGATAEAAHEAAAVTITDAAPIDLPGGAQITPTIAADWSVGDQWVIELVPPGVEYWPSSDRQNVPSAMVRYNMDGTLFETRGARFQLGAEWAIGSFPLISFKGAGLWQDPTALALGNPDFSAIREPRVLDSETFAMAIEPADLSAPAIDPTAQSIRLMGGADVRSKSRTGLDSVEIANHALTAEVLFELPRIDATDIWGWVDGYHRVRATVGTAQGQRCEIAIHKGQVGAPTTREDQEDAMVTLPLTCLPRTGGGDDEVSVRFF